MTRKDFEAMAAALAKAKPVVEAGYGLAMKASRYSGWLAACNAVANVFETANPRFDRARFLSACGVIS